MRAGARWVVLSGPTKSPDVPTIVHGVNRPDGETQILSCASCTTNNITPLVEILDRHFGVEKALLTTVHAYTATQALVDSPGGAKDLRRGRAAAQNFVLQHRRGHRHGQGPAGHGGSLRRGLHPWPGGRRVHLGRRLRLQQDTTVEAVNEVLRQEASTDRYQGVLGVAEEPLVSADIVKDPRASIVQLDLTWWSGATWSR